MTMLRWLGVAVGVALMAFAVGRRGRLFRWDLVLLGSLGVAAIVVSATGWAHVVLDAFGFHYGNNQQILGVVVFASVVLLALVALAFARIAAAHRDVDAILTGIAENEFRGQGMPERFAGKIAIVIPAYNEAENIGPVLDSLPPAVCGIETIALVVDDGSRDRTADVARAHGAVVIRHVVNRGGGAAMRTGYRVVADTSAEVLVAMDADGQHLPEDMERLVAPILEGKADLTNGSRILGSGVHVHPMRDLGLAFFNRVISFLTRTKVTDCSNGYRAMRPAILEPLVLEQNQFHTAEFLIQAIRHGVPAIEVPVTVTHRLSGTSKKPGVLRYGWGFANAIFRTWIR